MKSNYTRKAIFIIFILATLCQSFPTYLFEDDFHEIISLELDIDYENESESENEEQNKKDLEETKDKIYPKDIRFSIAKFGLKNQLLRTAALWIRNLKEVFAWNQYQEEKTLTFWTCRRHYSSSTIDHQTL